MNLTMGLRSVHALAAIVAAGAIAEATVAEDRTFDGSGNNVDNPDWGRVTTPFLRLSTVAYADGVLLPAGADRPNARSISNVCGAQADTRSSSLSLSNMHTLWGQFVDHDITLTPEGTTEFMPVMVESGDPWFDPDGGGGAMIPLMRSIFDAASGSDPKNPRQQVNTITAFIDGSMVYGSSADVAGLLRRDDGSGKLLTSAGDLLPYNDLGLDMANPLDVPAESLFAAGDVRANENCQLTAMHTLFLREHNRQCDLLAAAHPDWDGDDLYHHARKIIGGLIQRITYAEYLPVLLGADALPAYGGYDDKINPGIANAFQSCAFRFGHSQVNEVLFRLDDDGFIVPVGNIALRDAFFAPDRFVEVGVGSWLKGAAETLSQDVDMYLVSGIRNFMFGPPVGGGLDLFALNTQRGRDHGLPDYNQLRMDFEMPPMPSIESITEDPVARAALIEAFGDLDLIDPWVGAISEDHAPGAAVGPLLRAVIADQFARVRDGDRFWFQNDDAITPVERAEIEGTTLADVIRRNTSIGNVPDEVFVTPNGFEVELADLTLDGVVSLSDLTMLLQSWGPMGTPGQDARADLDGDGTIGYTDLIRLLGRWTM